MARKLRLGTRGSQLARVQAEEVRRALVALDPALEVETVVIETSGDRTLGRLGPESGKGLFTGELEAALAGSRVDLAVHSLKDLPTCLAPGLELLAIPERADPRDALASPLARRIADLPAGTRVGTSSLRRQARLRHLRPDLEVAELRGNVDTRLRKLAEGQYGAILVARAGLLRLGRADAAEPIAPEEMLPAPGQGALGIEARSDDREVAALLARLDHPPTRAACLAERALLARLEGGCHVPVGCLGEVTGGELALRAMVLAPDGSRAVEGQARGPAAEAEALGLRLADELLARGARDLLGG